MAATLSLRQALSQAAQLAAKGSFWDGPPGPGRLGPWSTLILGGQVFPGADGPDDPRACAVRLKGAVRYRIDSQKVKGGSGHKLVTEGYDPTQLTAAKVASPETALQLSVVDQKPWYTSPVVWGVTGAALVGIATVAFLLAPQPPQ